jgi:hypothetical protein
MSDLTIVGVCSYAPAVHRWLSTLREHFDGRCLLYLTEPSTGVADELKKHYAIEVVHVIVKPDYWKPKPVGTLCSQWHCIEEACTNRIKSGLVLRSDVWDVVFQADPRKYLQGKCDKIIVCHEGARLADEPCNRAWIRNWGELFGNGPVVNGGMICAPTASLAVLARIIKQAPLGTRIDQSELSLIVAALPAAFEYRPGFLECLYPAAARHPSLTPRASPAASPREWKGESGKDTDKPPTSEESWLTPRVSVTGRAIVIDGKFCDRATGQPWCVVHGNGPAKRMLDEIYPMARYL